MSSSDVRNWIGKRIVDVIDDTANELILLQVNRWAEGRPDAVPYSMRLVEKALPLSRRWASYDAFRREFYDESGMSVFSSATEHSIAGDGEQEPGALELWPWVVYDSLARAAESVAGALQDGILQAAGQREWIEAVGQAPESIPFQPLEDRMWRLKRKNAALEVFDKRKVLVETYRRVQFTQNAAPPGPRQASGQRGREEEIARIRQFLEQHGDLRQVGSRALAQRIQRELDPPCTLSIKNIEPLVIEARGHALKRGRPTRSREVKP